MTVCGFVGTFDDDISMGSIRGNGKTMSMVATAKRLHDEGWEIYANFNCTFAKYLSVDQMIAMFMNRGETFHHVCFLVDEIQQYVESLGDTKELKIFMGMVRQLRKRYSHLYWTSQRYLDVAKRLRLQTDEIITPRKFHLDRTLCRKDICDHDHIIILFKVRPYVPRPLRVLNPKIAGQLYNSDEIIIDRITLPKKEKT